MGAFMLCAAGAVATVAPALVVPTLAAASDFAAPPPSADAWFDLSVELLITLSDRV
jgi:hypothetical protein